MSFPIPLKTLIIRHLITAVVGSRVIFGQQVLTRGSLYFHCGIQSTRCLSRFRSQRSFIHKQNSQHSLYIDTQWSLFTQIYLGRGVCIQLKNFHSFPCCPLVDPRCCTDPPRPRNDTEQRELGRNSIDNCFQVTRVINRSHGFILLCTRESPMLNQSLVTSRPNATTLIDTWYGTE